MVKSITMLMSNKILSRGTKHCVILPKKWYSKYQKILSRGKNT